MVAKLVNRPWVEIILFLGCYGCMFQTHNAALMSFSSTCRSCFPTCLFSMTQSGMNRSEMLTASVWRHPKVKKCLQTVNINQITVSQTFRLFVSIRARLIYWFADIIRRYWPIADIYLFKIGTMHINEHWYVNMPDHIHRLISICSPLADWCYTFIQKYREKHSVHIIRVKSKTPWTVHKLT